MAEQLIPTAPAPSTPAPKLPSTPRKARAAVPADKYGWWWGTGRRKAGVARVRMKLAKDGKASIEIESKSGKRKPFDKYFAEERDRNDCVAPFKVTGTEGKFVVIVRVHGGGFMGQAGSVKLGLARALRAYDPSLEEALRDAGFLTRDARKVERKKYGQAGARRRFQFSKR